MARIFKMATIPLSDALTISSMSQTDRYLKAKSLGLHTTEALIELTLHTLTEQCLQNEEARNAQEQMYRDRAEEVSNAQNS